MLYAVGILGGAYIGYEMTKERFIKKMDFAQARFNRLNNQAWHRVRELQQELSEAKKQLTKFHQLRGKNGKFTKRQ